MQVSLQPFPSAKLPSSQVSDPTLLPSPQIGLHVVGDVIVPPVQFQPILVPLQSLLHPPRFRRPSSQVSGGITLLSPQRGMQIVGVVEVPPEQV